MTMKVIQHHLMNINSKLFNSKLFSHIQTNDKVPHHNQYSLNKDSHHNKTTPSLYANSIERENVHMEPVEKFLLMGESVPSNIHVDVGNIAAMAIIKGMDVFFFILILIVTSPTASNEASLGTYSRTLRERLIAHIYFFSLFIHTFFFEKVIDKKTIFNITLLDNFNNLR